MSIWTSFGTGNWFDAFNWSGGTPDANGAVADFHVLGAVAAHTHHIDLAVMSPFKVGTLSLQSSILENYSIEHGSLTMQAISGSAAINVSATGAGRPVANVLASNLTLQFNSDTIVTTTGIGTLLDMGAMVTGVGLLTKNGTGTLSLSNAANNWAGGTLINAGTVDLFNGAALGSGQFAFGGNSVLHTSATMILNNKINIHNGVSATISAASGTTLFLTGDFDSIGGSGTVLHFGGAADHGTVSFTQTNAAVGIGPNGTISIDGGTVIANYAFETMTSGMAGTNIAAGATLKINYGDVAGRFYINHLTGSGDITNVQQFYSSIVEVTENGDADYFGTLSDGPAGNIGLAKLGTGSLTLFGANTYRGFTFVFEGTLKTGVTNTLSATSSVGMQSPGVLDLQGLDQTVRSLYGGSGVIKGNSAGLVTFTLAPDLSVSGVFADDFGGVISDGSAVLGKLALKMNGPGTQFLSGLNTYTGTTYINQGILGLKGAGSIESSHDVVVAAAGTFSLAEISVASANVQSLTNAGAVDLAKATLILTHQTGNIGGTFLGSAFFNGLTVNMDAFLANFSLASAVFTNWTDTFDKITINGNALANTITGSSHADVIDGMAGADHMLGGLGSDTYYVDNAGDSTDETGGGGAGDRVSSSVSFSAAAGIEGLYLTGFSNINATGRALQNDLLSGNIGNNVLDGLSGNDLMRGGLGNDTYYVDSTLDLTDEVFGGGGTGDYVYSSVSFTASQGIERLYLTGLANINATGTALQNDILVGNSGNNVIDGLSGADVMRGALGNDIYYVDNSGDTTDEVTGGGGSDFVYSSVTYTASQGIDRLYLTGSSNINGTGRDGQNDILGGNSGSNVLSGLTGADTLIGGLGNDTLSGGTGADTFRFETGLNAATNMDTITDFAAVDDLIQLENAIFTALTITGALAAGAFNTGSAATQADDRIIYNTVTGALLYDADGLGGAAGVQFALLSTHPVGVSAADFLVY